MNVSKVMQIVLISLSLYSILTFEFGARNPVVSKRDTDMAGNDAEISSIASIWVAL